MNHSQGAPGTSHRAWETFSPAGLRVLVVDDDKLCLKVIAKMLQQCHYEGVTPHHTVVWRSTRAWPLSLCVRS
jgi:PleD family two-component response regulator